MDYQALLDWMDLAEKLKCNTRHSWTSSGRCESVAEHSFGLGMLAEIFRHLRNILRTKRRKRMKYRSFQNYCRIKRGMNL